MNVISAGANGVRMLSAGFDLVFVISAGGDGVRVDSAGGNGVHATSTSATSYGGWFSNSATGGTGVNARGGSNAAADVILGGSATADDGRIYQPSDALRHPSVLCTQPSQAVGPFLWSPRSHLTLLGDSTFDNAAYTEGGPDVVTQLNDLLPAGWAASLLAIDGSTTDDIDGQIGCLPADASHLVLSVGGNDAL